MVERCSQDIANDAYAQLVTAKVVLAEKAADHSVDLSAVETFIDAAMERVMELRRRSEQVVSHPVPVGGCVARVSAEA